MKAKHYFYIFLFITALSMPQEAYASNSKFANTNILDFLISDVDNDGELELVLLFGAGETNDKQLDDELKQHREKYNLQFGGLLLVYSIEDALTLKYKYDFTSICPLFIRAGDIDGDGLTELSMCVYKKTKFFPQYDKRPFFYRIEEGEMIPVWRGSRLTWYFDDYILFDIDNNGIDEIISISKTGKNHISAYYWDSFGFMMLGESQSFDEISDVEGCTGTSESGNYILIKGVDGGKEFSKKLYYKVNEMAQSHEAKGLLEGE